MERYDREQLLKDNAWTPEEFESTGLKWDQLDEIHDHHVECKPELSKTHRYVAASLEDLPDVHSIRHRIKSPVGLVAKIIRKKLKEPERIIDLSTYRTEITDLIGIRALHLFKGQWKPIHDFIVGKWEAHETPIAYIRDGDARTVSADYRKSGCTVDEHPMGYRSVHHVIKMAPDKVQKHLIEIQIRTIFEEGWSEIDHRVRYPRHSDNPVLNQFIDIFNRFAGSADEMGTFVDGLHSYLIQQTKEVKALSEELASALEQANMTGEEKKDLLTKIKQLQKSSNTVAINSLPLPTFGIKTAEVRSNFQLFSSSLPIVQTRKCSKCGRETTSILLGTDGMCQSCSTQEVMRLISGPQT